MSGRIVVVGAGTMGAGIAQVAVEAGYYVTVVDTTAELVVRAITSITSFLNRKVEKGSLPKENFEEILCRLGGTTNLAEAVSGSVMVVEAVYEDLQVKHNLFKELDRLCPPEIILASNTSTISITKIAEATDHPERVIGTHYFSPVPLMRLVEVVNGAKTSKSTAERTLEICRDLGKSPIVVKDVPGFIVNRLLCLLYNETANMIKNGVASAEDIDTAVKLGCNWPMGVAEIMDMAGVDVVLHAMRAMHEMTAEDRYRPSPLLAEMVERNHLGRKAGQGFYCHRK